MTKCTATLAGLLLIVSTGLASEPGSARPSNKYAPIKRLPPNPYLKAAADLDARDRMMARNAAEFAGMFVLPQPRIADYFEAVMSERYSSDPNYRMVQLLNKSEDLRQAREMMHRFLMNNQPAVLTFDRLKGAIGP